MFRIGWATQDMTPERPVMLDGQHYVRISTHVNDPLTVTALALEGDAGEQAILISCDLVSINAECMERVREVVRPRLADFDVSRLFTNTIHTHSAFCIREGNYPRQAPEVMTPTEGLEWFARKAADAAEAAWKNRKPGGVSRAFGHAVVGHNRRATYFDGSSRMYGKTNLEEFEHIEGYEDHSLDVLFTWDDRKQLNGVVVNLACPSQVVENSLYISADFWHETRIALRKRLGAEVSILAQCAAAGDQSPHFLLYGSQEEFMRKRSGLTECQEIARRIANGVAEVFETSRTDIATQVPFRHVVEVVELPARKITDEEYQVTLKDYERLRQEEAEGKAEGPHPTRHAFLRRCEDVRKRYEAQKTRTTYAMELHVLRIGDVAVVTNPFELFLDYGLRIKARSSAPQTFVVQLAAGSGRYLPTRRALAARSYGAGAADNLVGPEGGQGLVNRTLDLIHQLWTD